MTSELKACPFCGKMEHLFTEPDERGSGGQWIAPIHAGCGQLAGCGVSVMGDTEAEAIAAWNRRTDPALADALAENERLREALAHLEPILRRYNHWIMTKDYDMDGECPHECLETEADTIRAALGGNHD